MSESHRFFVPVGMVSLPAAPVAPEPGDTYFDSVLKRLRTWDGSTWISAAFGDAGPVGPTGPTGPTGPQGARGLVGATGPQGIQGLRGETGATGPVGPQGVAGGTGAQGPVGAAGPQGIPGPTGPTGPQGAMGSVGAIGAKGDTGPTGPTGPPGTGATGPTGPQGPPGSGARVWAGGVPAGSVCQVTHSLGTRDVSVQVYLGGAPYTSVQCDVERTSVDVVTLYFAVPVVAGVLRCVVTGG